MTDTYKGTKLTWTALPTKEDFVSYRVYRSINDDTINEKNLSINAFVISNMADVESNNFLDNNQSFGTFPNNSFYRIEAVFKNRSIWSKNVLLVDKTEKINETFSTIYTDKETSKLYMYNSDAEVVKIYDLEKQKLLDTKLNLTTNFVLDDVAFGTFNGRREMYAIHIDEMQIYDANTFELIKTIDLGRNVSKMIVGKNNMLYLSLKDNLYSVMSFDRSTETKSLHKQITNGVYFTLMYLPLKNKLVALYPNFSQSTLNYLDLSDDGKTIISSTPKVFLGAKLLNTNSKSLINYLSNNETFVIGNQISFFDKDFKFLNTQTQDFNGEYDNYIVLNNDNIIAVRESDRSIRQINSKGTITEKLIIKHFPRQIISINDKKWIVYSIKSDDTYIEKFEF